MMKLKIYGKKTENNSSEALCLTCKASSRIRTAKNEYFVCHVFDTNIYDKVLDCNRYSDARLVDVNELHSQAFLWVGDDVNRFLSQRDYNLYQMGELKLKPEPEVVKKTVN